MASGYRTLKQRGRAEIVIKKSRFIATASPVQSEAEAQSFVEEIRKEFWDATHNVYAFVIGQNDQVARSSDDGEPSGTAGRPVLEVVKREEMRYSAVVVTRYFGGILLGAGGLIRAYAASAREGLRAAGIVRMRPVRAVRFACEYASYGAVQNLISGDGLELADVDYAEDVRIAVIVPSEQVEGFSRRMMDLLSGRFHPEIGPEMMAPVAEEMEDAEDADGVDE